jgi:hypothetical protein
MLKISETMGWPLLLLQTALQTNQVGS